MGTRTSALRKANKKQRAEASQYTKAAKNLTLHSTVDDHGLHWQIATTRTEAKKTEQKPILDIHDPEWALAVAQQADSRLLSLPGEIRSLIWKFVLTVPEEPLTPESFHDSYQLSDSDIPGTSRYSDEFFYNHREPSHVIRPVCKRSNCPRCPRHLAVIDILKHHNKAALTSRQCFIDIIEGSIFYRSNTFNTTCLVRPTTKHAIKFFRSIETSKMSFVSSFSHFLKINDDSTTNHPGLDAFAKLIRQNPTSMKRLTLDIFFRIGPPQNHRADAKPFTSFNHAFQAIKARLEQTGIQKLKSFDLNIFFAKVSDEEDRRRLEQRGLSMPPGMRCLITGHWIDLPERTLRRLTAEPDNTLRDSPDLHLMVGLMYDGMFRSWQAELRDMLTETKTCVCDSGYFV